jgi:hypothetical protein
MALKRKHQIGILGVSKIKPIHSHLKRKSSFISSWFQVASVLCVIVAAAAVAEASWGQAVDHYVSFNFISHF